MKLVITGGHHSSALPLLSEISKRSLAIDPFWIGHKHSLKGDMHETLEYKEITALGIPFFELKTGKIYKSYNPLNYFKVIFAIFVAFKYLAKTKPDLILSFGGYLAVPVVLAAKLLSIPVITHEQTVVVGYANKLVSYFADKILISWQASKKYFPAHKVIFSGLPLREAIFTPQPKLFESDNDLPTVFCLAGKSGSVKINDAMVEILPELLTYCNLIHQTGDYSLASSFSELTQTYNEVRSTVPGKLYLHKHLLATEIGSAYAQADLVMGRAGAHFTAELLALNKPALLIPISWVSHNEQYENALLLKNAGLGEILEETDLTGPNLLERLKYMLRNREKYKNTLPTNFVEISKNATNIILAEVLKYESKKA